MEKENTLSENIIQKSNERNEKDIENGGKEEKDNTQSGAEVAITKRKPGRPRKNPLPASEESSGDMANNKKPKTEKKASNTQETVENTETTDNSSKESFENTSNQAIALEESSLPPREDVCASDADSTATAEIAGTDTENYEHESLIELLLKDDKASASEKDETEGEPTDGNESPMDEDFENGDYMYALPFDSPERSDGKEPEATLIDEEEDEDADELPPYNPNNPRKIDARFDLVELFIITLAIVMVISAFFFRHTVVDGASMESTLYDQEHLIISDVFYTPKRGDIIVFADYTTSIKKNLVKRVIAVGGDTVKITRKGEVFVNGKLLKEDYVYINEPEYMYRAIELTVPEGELFVMGDHRNESIDSRDPYIGTISEDSVLGRVLVRIYPFDKFGNPDKYKE